MKPELKIEKGFLQCYIHELLNVKINKELIVFAAHNGQDNIEAVSRNVFDITHETVKIGYIRFWLTASPQASKKIKHYRLHVILPIKTHILDFTIFLESEFPLNIKKHTINT